MTTENRTQNSNKSKASSTQEQVPPHNLDAESSLIGAALLYPLALETLATKTTPTDYYSPAYRAIAGVMITTFEADSPVDLVTVADALTRAGLIEEIGGQNALLDLMSNAPGPSNAPRYAEIIHDHATSRRLIVAAGQINLWAHSGLADIHSVVERAQTAIVDVASQNGSRSYSTLEIPDMAAVLKGDLTQVQPDLLKRSDGLHLFYTNKMNVLQAEPGVGKSWIAKYASVEVLAMGGAVIYLDYEDDERGIVNGLIALGADPAHVADNFLYVRPTGGMGHQEKTELLTHIKRLNPDLVVIDGVAEALSRDGYDEDKNSDVVAWVDNFPRWISLLGPGVVMIDHVTKSADKTNRFARGAGHKLAAGNGISYTVKLVKGFSRQQEGLVKLIIAKDRPGAIGPGDDVAALVKIRPQADGAIVRMYFDKPAESSIADGSGPTYLMRMLSESIQNNPHPVGKSMLFQLNAGLSGKAHLTEALAQLTIQGFVTTYRDGSNKEKLRVVKPYTTGAKPPEPAQGSLGDIWVSHSDELAKKRQERIDQASGNDTEDES